MNLIFDTATTTEVLAATTDAEKEIALKAAMGTVTQTVSIKDAGAVEKLSGTFSGALYDTAGESFLPSTLLASVAGAGGTAGTGWTCRITSANGRWMQGEFGAGEIFSASTALSSANSNFLTMTLPGTASPGSPPSTVRDWMLRTTDAPITVPAYFMGIHAHRYPDNPTYITTPSPAFSYPFGTARSVDYEYIMWSNIHTAANTYNWAAMDVWVDFHSAAGHKIMYTILSTPAWAAATSYTNAWGVVGGAGGVASQTNLSNFVTTLVTRYNTDTVRNNNGLKKITFIECWNEPDYFPYTANIFYKDTPESMAQMNRTIYQAAKAVDSTITVFTPGVVDCYINDFDPQPNPTKVSKLAAASDSNSGTGKLWHEELGWHWYDYQSPANAATNALKLNKLITTMRTVHTVGGYSSSLPMHITEIGGWGWSVSTPTDANKVKWILRTAMIAAARGIKSISYYAHEDANYLGAPATNATIAAAMTLANNSLVSKVIRQGAILQTNEVWIEFTDGTQILDGSAL